MNDKRKTYGLPCVGGKTALAPYLCEVIEQCAEDYHLSTYISACGGGGKDIFSLRDGFFDKYIYNEIELPVAKLVEALTSRANVDDIECEVERIIERALQTDAGVIDIQSKQEEQLRKMFNDIYNLFKEKHTEQIEKMSLIELAARGVILVYGSVQNNRKTIHYKSKSGEYNFLKNMYSEFKYYNKLCDISEHAQGVEVINGDCFDIIEKYNNDENVFIYIDPPYWNCSIEYTNTFDFNDHIKLTNLCRDAKCKIMISMHEFGIAPYLLSLYPDNEWHIYQTPNITHSSRSNKLNKQIIKQLISVLECNEQVLENLYIDNKTIHEYVFTNFEFYDDNFEKIEINDDFSIEGTYTVSDEANEPDHDNADYRLDRLFESAIYSLYMGKCGGKTDRGIIDESICNDILDTLKTIMHQGTYSKYKEETGDVFNLADRSIMIKHIKKIIKEHNKTFKSAN